MGAQGNILALVLLTFSVVFADTPKKPSPNELAQQLLSQLLLEKNWTQNQVEILNSLLLEKLRVAEMGLPEDIASLMQVALTLDRDIRVHATTVRTQADKLKAQGGRRAQQAQLLLVSPELLLSKSQQELQQKLPRFGNILQILKSRVEELSPTQKEQLNVMNKDHEVASSVLASLK